MGNYKSNQDVMKQALHLMLKLDEKQLLVAKGVMTGMLLEHALKDKKEKVS